MEAQDRRSQARPVTRRQFLKTASGVIALSIIGAPAASQSARRSGTNQWAPQPGIAQQRVEGLAKVTGQKIFARDFNARDMPDWPDHQWHALFLRAHTTERVFEGLDLNALPASARPARVVLGSDLSAGQRAPNSPSGRDLLVDTEHLADRQDHNNFDKPRAVEFDLVVQPGNKPDFPGQAVGLLMFDNIKSCKTAKAALQFNQQAFQIYGPDTGPAPQQGELFGHKTLYVREAADQAGDSLFSYATTEHPDRYTADARQYMEKFHHYLATEPDLAIQSFDASMQAMDPMFMEPESGLVWYNRADRKLNLLLGTQSPDGDIAEIAQMAGEANSPIDVNHIVLTSCFPGGGFGGRDSSPFSLMLALTAAFSHGNPVRLEYDRFEQFQVGLKRHACRIHGTLAASQDQKIQLVEMDLAFDGGGRRNLSPYVASLGALCAGGAYDVPRANIHAHAYHSQNVSAGSQRGFGGPQAFFAIETAIDDLARRQHWDPLQFRLNNVLTEKDATVAGGPVDQPLQLADMLERAATHPLWQNRETIKRDNSTDRLAYGTGLAMSLQAYGTSGDGVVAAILMDEQGRFTVQSDAVDMGNGSATTLGVVIADSLGTNASKVEMGSYHLFGQTGLSTSIGKNNWDNPKWTAKGVGSSSACLTGLHQVHVVREVARALFETVLLPAARDLWALPELTTGQTRWHNSALNCAGKQPIRLPTLAARAHATGLARGALGHAFFQSSWVQARYPTPHGELDLALDGLACYPADGGPARPIWRRQTRAPAARAARYARSLWSPCVNVIGLTLDKTTGAVQIENVVSVLNAGKIHIEAMVSGQSQGGLAQAIGWTLLEDMPAGINGPAGGDWNLNRYHVPRYTDVPLGTEYRAGHRSQQLITMPAGIERTGRGIAEAVMCSVAPAISNALKDAVGIRYASLPITADKILAGLK